jgi:hypothetical protein
MNIKHLSETYLLHQCSKCNIENSIALKDIVVYPGAGNSQLILRLPSCSCGTTVFMYTRSTAPVRDSQHLIKCLIARVVNEGQLALGADAGVVGTLRAALTSAYSAKGNQILIKELSGELKLDRAPVDLTY